MLRQLTVLVWATLFACTVSAADTYDGSTNILSIPLVKVGDSLYQDVKITVGTIVSVGTGPSADTFDTYNASNGQLSIPLVSVGGTLYYDVVITVGTIFSVGPSCLIDSTCIKVGTQKLRAYCQETAESVSCLILWVAKSRACFQTPSSYKLQLTRPSVRHPMVV